ncbi:MAG: hypothetical protein AVDCRST_MAG53-556 [uncultured Solirubrobacteraceae bacterium]|uniref:Uncharacterized protein n=1 Tax=uncultured Solirubrobacteraceae bacterium TaxID=1162706 RepID=A0A6J4RYD7_9ACTN|nr:MAG: hypothetical protein AVDCRST_MAG53-556 [uncultured Solirubrobacteraceae bacterium]
MTVVHWDDRPGDDLAAAVGAGWACLRRITIDARDPLHLDAEDRETIVWTLDRDAVIVRRPADLERSVRAQATLDVLVFAAGRAGGPWLGAPPSRGVVQPSEVEGERVVDGLTSIVRRDVGGAAGAVAAGVELVDIAPARRGFPSPDREEVSVVLQGSGRVVAGGAEPWVVRGSVVGRAERFVAGPQGLRVLSFRELAPPA